MLSVTTDSIPGRNITAVLGMLVACVPYWGSKYAEGITNASTGETVADLSTALERRRLQVLIRLEAKAANCGADALVGVRFDVREITGAWKELCAYGTAVELQRRGAWNDVKR